MHGGWWTALILTALRTTDVWRPATGGVVIVFLIGVAIAAGGARSRMRLSDTITQVFQTGLTAAVALQTNVVTTACIVEADLEGNIRTIEHPEVIGWENGDLEDRPFEDLVPDRFLRLHLATLKQLREDSSEGLRQGRTAGVTLNMPIVGEDKTEAPIRMTVARLGERLVISLVPASSSASYTSATQAAIDARQAVIDGREASDDDEESESVKADLTGAVSRSA